MSTKVITNIKVAFRPDIQYLVREESSFWSGKTKRDWFFSVGSIHNPWSSYTVSMGWYNEKDHMELLRFMWFLDNKYCHMPIDTLRRMANSYKLKQILESFNGLYFKRDTYKPYPYREQESALLFSKKNSDGSKIYAHLVAKEKYDPNAHDDWDKYKAYAWEYRTNISDDNNKIVLSKEEYDFIYYSIRFSYLLNMKWSASYQREDYFVFTFIEDCIEQAISKDWIKTI